MKLLHNWVFLLSNAYLGGFFLLLLLLESLMMDWFYLFHYFHWKICVIVEFIICFLMVSKAMHKNHQFKKWMWESLGDFYNILNYVSLTCTQNNGNYTEHFHDEEDWVSKWCKHDNALSLWMCVVPSLHFLKQCPLENVLIINSCSHILFFMRSRSVGNLYLG